MLIVTITSSLLVSGDADVSDGVFQLDRLGSLLKCNTQRAGFWYVNPYIGKKKWKTYKVGVQKRENFDS